MKDLVLLHGALGSADQLDALAHSLRGDFTVHRLDFEGHGHAPGRARPFRIAHFVENVLEFMDRDRIERAEFFGYSMGGYIALCFALDHPDRVERIATLGTKYRWDPATAAREASRLDPQIIRAKVPRFADVLEARHQSAGGWEAVLARTADFLRELGEHPSLTDDALSRISHSVRVIVGDRDNTVTVEESEGVASRLSSGSFSVLRDAPHPIEQVAVDRLAAELRGFFAPGSTV